MAEEHQNAETVRSSKASSVADAAAAAISRLGEREKRKRRQRDLRALSVLFAVCLVVGIFGWYTGGRIFTVPINAIWAFEAPKHEMSRNPAVNCRNPANARTPYCQNRKGETREQWEGIARGGGKASPFTLNGRQ